MRADAERRAERTAVPPRRRVHERIHPRQCFALGVGGIVSRPCGVRGSGGAAGESRALRALQALSLSSRCASCSVRPATPPRTISGRSRSSCSAAGRSSRSVCSGSRAELRACGLELRAARPRPVADFGHVLAIAPDVFPMLDQLVADTLPHAAPMRLHPPDDRYRVHQGKAVYFVEHRHVEGRGSRALSCSRGRGGSRDWLRRYVRRESATDSRETQISPACRS